jgi:hypothetical protein
MIIIIKIIKLGRTLAKILGVRTTDFELSDNFPLKTIRER